LNYRDKPELRERLAAEYALGTLRGRARERLRSWLRDDAELAREVAAWEARLAPMAQAVEPVTPPARIWAGVERQLGGAAHKPFSFWKTLGLIASGAAAALLGSMEAFPPRYPELRLPILLQQGTADALVDIAGTRQLETGAVNATVTTHYYDGLYHEIFNEPEQAAVIADTIAWLDSVMADA